LGEKSKTDANGKHWIRLFHANLFSSCQRFNFGCLKTGCLILSGLVTHYDPLVFETETHYLQLSLESVPMFLWESEKTVAMPIGGTFNSAFLQRMDSESTTNRTGFLKRAGLALVGAFAVTSGARATVGGAAPSRGAASPQGAASIGVPDAPESALARVRKAKGAVARHT
jgi:hypothetical protein